MLLSNGDSASFLPDCLRSLHIEEDGPDIIVFGFQEVIDLEDRKLTASQCLEFLIPEDNIRLIFLLRRNHVAWGRKKEKGRDTVGRGILPLSFMAGLHDAFHPDCDPSLVPIFSDTYRKFGRTVVLRICQELGASSY